MSSKQITESNVVHLYPDHGHPDNHESIQRMKAAVLKMEGVATSVVADTRKLNTRLAALDEKLQTMSDNLTRCNDIYSVSLRKLASARKHCGNNST
jgi:hypothetical protein